MPKAHLHFCNLFNSSKIQNRGVLDRSNVSSLEFRVVGRQRIAGGESKLAFTRVLSWITRARLAEGDDWPSGRSSGLLAEAASNGQRKECLRVAMFEQLHLNLVCDFPPAHKTHDTPDSLGGVGQVGGQPLLDPGHIQLRQSLFAKPVEILEDGLAEGLPGADLEVFVLQRDTARLVILVGEEATQD